MSLEQIIRREIEQDGPISVARYMELCLAHPTYGYYKTRDPLGRPGDFTTAPEISQMFGEMIGVWVASVWQSLREPEAKLVELGPGRGTLMSDIRRVLCGIGIVPDTWMVETSPVLREQQRARVPDARWADTIAAVPDGPLIVVANEFFDALPVRQYVSAPDGTREVRVGVGTDGALSFGLGSLVPAGDLKDSWDEISPASDAIARALAERLELDRGAALVIDYGFGATDRPEGPTLQALRKHERADPLSSPGSADLTTLVDFDRLAAAFAPLPVSRTEQGHFLAQLGIGARAQALVKREPAQANDVADALERLTSAKAMGTLFKVLAVHSPDVLPPPGFEE